jgi:hypothetical protein
MVQTVNVSPTAVSDPLTLVVPACPELPNKAPVVLRTGSFAVDYNAASCKVFDVLPNVSDPDGDQLSMVGVVAGKAPAHGVVTRPDGNPFVLCYKPNTNWYGTDNFTFRAADSHGATVDGLVQVNVSQPAPPPAPPDSAYPQAKALLNPLGIDETLPYKQNVCVSGLDPNDPADKLVAVRVEWGSGAVTVWTTNLCPS